MNNLITKLNSTAVTNINIPVTPGQWLASLATFHGRNKVKARQANLLAEYINEADTLVQAVNIHYQEIEMPIMKSWFSDEKTMIRNQFKRSIAPYLQNANRHPDSTASIVAFEFFSKINPAYYELMDGIANDEALVDKTASMMDEMARTHQSLKGLFDTHNRSTAVKQEIQELRQNLSGLKEIFNKGQQENLSFYDLIQHENNSKNSTAQ